MLDGVLGSVNSFIVEAKQLNKWSQWKSYVIAFLAVCGLVASIFIPNQTLEVVVSSLSGVALFFGLYIVWFTGIPKKYADMLEVRAKYDIFYRRRIIVVAVLVWVLAVLFLTSYLPSGILGGVTVTVFLIFLRIFTPTEDEKEETERIQNEVYEETIQEEIEKKKRKKKTIAPPKRKKYVANEEDYEEGYEEGYGDDSLYEDEEYYEDDTEDWDDLEEDDDSDWDEKKRKRKK